MFSKPLIIEYKEYLLNQGWVYNIYCGLTALWAFCKVCDRYCHHTPYTKGYDYKYVCNDCETYSTQAETRH